MGELRYEPDLLDEIAHRLDLRAPNRSAIESVALRTSQHYDVDQMPGPFECIVDSATGVGKTYVMAGLVEYLAGAQRPARNFLLLAPGRTIRDKSIQNFTPGHGKSLTAAMRSRPYLVTSENFATPATFKAMSDPSVTKLYVFTVQALTSATGDGRATHEYQEDLGGSFFDFLAGLDDLVILADEHHCYRGPAFSRTISSLAPELVVGLTATPVKADEGLVVYRYPLAQAIHDQLVKTPVVVGRKDDRKDDETKLLDGVTLLRYKERLAHSYCQDNDLPPVNPVMLVVAKDIAEAQRYRDILDSDGFDGGAWVGKTLLVHSDLKGDEKEQALADLEEVEQPGSRVRIILNVAQLKEGWDVKNVYVIASMRASASAVLTEQTLGRGMRLPFGSYTGIEMLDTVEVLAHERYSELLARRDVLNEKFIDYGTYAELRRRADGSAVVRQQTAVSDGDVIAPAAAPAAPLGEQRAAAPDRPAGVVDVETRTLAAATIAQSATQTKHAFYPQPGMPDITIPLVVATARPAAVSLHDIDADEYARFDRLGVALTADHSDQLRRTKIVAREHGGQVRAETEAASDVVRAGLALDVPLAESRRMLVRRIVTGVKGVQARPVEVGAAERIVDRLIAAMGDEAATYLSAFPETCSRRLADEVARALGEVTKGSVEYDDVVRTVTLGKVRESTRQKVAGHADGSFSKTVAFNGWQRNLYSHAWFDTSTEFKAAGAIDAGPTVAVWARLHLGDIPITWTAAGRQYNPDFVVMEEVDGTLHGWLVETKMNREITSQEVRDKRKAARKWASVVNVSPAVGATWGYLLLSEDDVDDAQGSWESLKAYAQ